MSVCGRCNVTSDLPGLWWQNCWYCSAVCSHAAGDRTACSGWNCGCSKYAKKRRNLRHHRINMRVMDDVIAENGLQEELQDRLLEETGNSKRAQRNRRSRRHAARHGSRPARPSGRPKHNGPGCARRAGMSQAAKGLGARSHGAGRHQVSAASGGVTGAIAATLEVSLVRAQNSVVATFLQSRREF